MNRKNVWEAERLWNPDNYISVEIADQNGLLRSHETPETAFIRIESLTLLSKECLDLFIILLYSTDELEHIVRTGIGRKSLTLRKLKQFLKQHGARWKITKAFLAELKAYKTYLELK